VFLFTCRFSVLTLISDPSKIGGEDFNKIKNQNNQLKSNGYAITNGSNGLEMDGLHRNTGAMVK